MRIRELFDNTVTSTDQPIRPFIIAEAGVNHEGKMDLAKRLIDDACEGGADAIKFQTYKAASIASRHSPAYWDLSKEPTRNQYDLFKKYDAFSAKNYEELKNFCDAAEIEFLSTPFDRVSADFLNDLVPAFKISSSDITNRPFVEHIARSGKPIILSTGASYIYEIEETVSWIEPYGVPLALLHCILNYPTADSDANLGMILHLRKKFPDHLIGYSDHTLPGEMKILEIATILGAVILEKHFTFDKTLPGNDHYHAMDKADLKQYRERMSRIAKIVGGAKKKPLPSEASARENARRSLVARRFIAKGKKISTGDLTWKRPAFGICPKHIDRVIGQVANCNIQADAIIYWPMLGALPARTVNGNPNRPVPPDADR